MSTEDLFTAPTSTLTRVLPPSGLLSNCNDVPLDQAAQAARYERLQGVHTVEGIIGLVPDDYRSCLRPHLREVANTTKKLVGVVGVLAKYRSHSAAGTYPPFISKQAPSLQLTKEYAGTAEGSSHQKGLTIAHKAYCDSLLSKAILAKEQEQNHLEQFLRPQALFDAMGSAVYGRTREICERSKLPVFGEDENGNITFSRWETNHAAESLGRAMSQDVVVYAYRIRACVEATADITASKVAAKSKVRRDADVDMADAGSSTGIDKRKLQSMIDKAVSNKVKAGKSSKKVSDALFYIASTLTVVPLGFEQEEGEENFQRQTSSQGNERLGSRHQSATCQKSWQICKRDVQKVQGVTGERQEEKEVVRLLLPIFMGRAPLGGFRYDNHLTYPDFLLTISRNLAINFVILNTPIDVILASQFKNTIHKSPGVDIPLHIEHQLSVGIKYMFLQPHNIELFTEAYNDFSRRLKWRLYFALSGKGTNSDYDPDYEVSSEPSAVEPKLPHYLLSGINKGREYVNNTILKTPKTVVTHGTPLVNRKEIGDFLLNNEYIITMTDKNLGLAVSRCDWIIENCLKLLNDTDNYECLHFLKTETILDAQHDEMESIAASVDEFYGSNSQLAKYLRSNLFKEDPLDGETIYVLPRFYGIPKIHKHPVKMRPIIPCHSAVQNPAAKYCSKMLKPIIESAPTIIHGTKHLAQTLSQLKIDHSRKYYIVTGDVVAFYPNINITKCIDIVINLYTEYLERMDYDEATMNFLITLFKRCCMVGNTSLVTRFNNKNYLQKNGLAMGVSDSPDLANLYGYYFERSNKLLSSPECIFYGRYIDDCLAIVYADSEETALAMTETITFDSCVIEWQASSFSQVFLDMKLYIDDKNRLQHLPYRKANNHLERIPWFSHHPIDVKRGTFLGELSRLAVLSSLETSYHDAVNFLIGLYIVRGYPSDLVYRWSKENIQERWSKRFSDRRENTDVLVLKTVYNTAWNYFNAKELGDTIFTYWRSWLIQHDRDSPIESSEYPNEKNVSRFTEWPSHLLTSRGVPDVRQVNIDRRKVIVSRKRTRNLLDMTGLWKNRVLAQMEDRILNPANTSVD